jgi:hypothetical protein
MVMAETVKLPGAGPVKKTWVYAGGALLVGIVGYAYYKRSRAPVVEPINPDALPEDRVPFTDAQVSSGLGESQTAGAPVTVSDWVRQATDRLIELGGDATLIASALGKYVTHQKLTEPEADLVRQAVGQFGYPTNDAGSYPIILAPVTTTPPPTGGTSNHKYVVQIHIPAVKTPVRDLVKRFSDPSPAISTGNNIQVAVVRTQADPRNVGDIRTGVALAQHKIYVTTVQKA